MKTLTATITTAVVICTISSVTAGPRNIGPAKNGIRKADAKNIAERAATREEILLHIQDAHAWKKDPEARDYRPENLREYSNHTYKRIVRLLSIGALEETNGTKFKNHHEAIVQATKAAGTDGLDLSERKLTREKLNKLNDEINAAIIQPEQGSDRTPIVNRAQHRFEEQIEFGIKSGRLSTLEASSLRRKVTKLEGLEDRLKAGKELSTTERERLMKETLEIQRDIKKALSN